MNVDISLAGYFIFLSTYYLHSSRLNKSKCYLQVGDGDVVTELLLPADLCIRWDQEGLVVCIFSFNFNFIL